MRLTVDVDGSLDEMHAAVYRGYILLGKEPDSIRRTDKGYHVIWRNIRKMTDNEMAIYRYILGDDENRIKLDLKMKKKPKQVLFKKKTKPVYWEGQWRYRICEVEEIKGGLRK